MERSFRTIDVWKARTGKQHKKLPLGVRAHLLLLLDHIILNCGCDASSWKKSEQGTIIAGSDGIRSGRRERSSNG